MIDYKGLKLPDGETHLIHWMEQMGQTVAGRPAYQHHKYLAALRHVPAARRRVAVDVGAHIGQWSYAMAQDFAFVHAFEPVPRYQECWHANLKGVPHVYLHECALGAAQDVVSLHCATPGSHGDTRVAQAGEAANAAVSVPMNTLDSFKLDTVDLLKVDNEGYEFFVVQGARETLLRTRPVVIVEQKPGHAARYGLRDKQAVEALQELGMVLLEALSGDYILGWGAR